MKIQKFLNKTDFIQAATAIIANYCRTKSHIGLSGGSTPQPIYEELAQKTEINWSQIHFYQVDERFIAKTDPDSNYQMIYESLIEPTGANFHYFNTDLDIENCLNDYETELRQIPNQNLDLCILGMGTDGHTASLFPHSQALDEHKLVAHSQTEEFAIKDRLTITWPMIMQSQTILLLLSGASKEASLETLLNEDRDYQEFPAKKLLEHPNLEILFNLD